MPRTRTKGHSPASPAPQAGPSTVQDPFQALSFVKDIIPRMKNEDVLDAISASETAVAMKEMNEKDTTPMLSRKSRKHDVTPTLQLPTCLRMNVTPTKKVPLEMVKAFNARKQHVEQEIAMTGSKTISAHVEQEMAITGPEAISVSDIRPGSVPLLAEKNLEYAEQTRAKSAMPMISGIDLNTNIAPVCVPSATLPVVNADQVVMSASMMPPSAIIPRVSPQTQTVTGQYAVVLQKQIMDVQQHIQTLQQQMQTCILEPAPGAPLEQLFNIQHQSAMAQNTLQQLLQQYSQLIITESTALMMNPAQSMMAESSASIPPSSHLATKENPTLLFEDMPSVSSPLKGGPRQRSLSQTLSELGFEEISIPGQPGSLPKKSTALPTSLQNTSEVSGLVVSANDAFSRMGTGKRRPKVRRSKTPAPAEITPSVAVEVTSEHRATTPTPAHAVAATSEQVKLPPASALFDEDVVFQSASTTNDAPSVAIMSAEHQELAPLLQDMPWMNTPETVLWQPEEPRTAQLFPGLPAFNPTETSLEDLNLDAEDLTVLPAELQQMLQEHEPLVDNKG
ncbi:hypothetical protein M378DRAFT_28711, partial [Amanita muscaria Koide BX008]